MVDSASAIRIPPELILRIDDYARKQKISRSEALRALAVIALDKVKA
jgi:metal-responsive CopG/Arc/MetJ family transcriptional regulator